MKENKIVTLRGYPGIKGKVHYLLTEEEESFVACNTINPRKGTKDKNKVTCKGCLNFLSNQ